MAAGRIAATTTAPIVERVLAWLAPHCERIEPAGSYRRGKAGVKDIEMVVLEPKPSYFAELDAALAAGRIDKARLGESGATRWGAKYRSIAIDGLTVELFTCTWDNCGYQMWLRTGPGDANHFLVTRIKYGGAPFRVEKGYLYAGEQKLSIKTEADFFALCGWPYIEPHLRSEKLYADLFQRRGWRWGDPTAYVLRERPALQNTLFQDAVTDVPGGAQAHRQADLDVQFRDTWAGRAEVFVARLDTELAFARAAYAKAQRAEATAQRELEEQMVRDENRGASKATMDKHRAEYASALSEARYDMKQALDRADWLRACRFCIWLGEMVRAAYADIRQRQAA